MKPKRNVLLIVAAACLIVLIYAAFNIAQYNAPNKPTVTQTLTAAKFNPPDADTVQVAKLKSSNELTKTGSSDVLHILVALSMLAYLGRLYYLRKDARSVRNTADKRSKLKLQ